MSLPHDDLAYVEDEVSYTVLWSVVNEELPALELLLSSLLEE